MTLLSVGCQDWIFELKPAQ